MHRKMKKLHISRMSLIEVLIAMVILVIIMGFLTMMISKTQIVTRQQTRRSNIYNQQRLFFDILSRDLESIVVIDEDSIPSDHTYNEGIKITLISGNGLSFISASGIGRRSQDSSLNLEVKYALDGTDLKRYYSAQGHGGSWDYKTNDGWNGTMGDESAVLQGVRDFDIDIYDVNGNLMTTYDSWVLPSYIEVKITIVPDELKDDTSSSENQFRYSFSKIIYFQNGE